MTASFTLSAFGDEIAIPLDDQLTVMNELRIPGLELRTAWGTNVLHMNDEQAAQVREVCDRHNIHVSCIGSPIGKSPLTDPIDNEINNVKRLADICQIVGASRVRIFSFYPPDTSTNAHYDQHVDEAADRLAQLAKVAAESGLTLLHENEKDIVGDTPERCHALVTKVDNPNLRLIWDPANFVQVGVREGVSHYWDLLGPHIGYIHIKDALLDGGGVRAAGEGDGQVRLLLEKLRDADYQGVLALEPHLAMAGHSTGFSGPDGMAYAVRALRGLLTEIGQTDTMDA
jgi:sugar phosphate isomerase/epimerase